MPLHRPVSPFWDGLVLWAPLQGIFQRGENDENRVLERAPAAVTDARPAAAPARSFSPSGACLFLAGHTSPLPLQSYEYVITQFNLHTQSELTG